MGAKLCVKCGLEKTTDEFYLKGNGRLHSWCNDCRKNEKREWSLKNKEHIRKYKERTREHKIRKDAEYRMTHREKLRLTSAIFNKKLKEKRKLDRLKPANRERERERGRRWRINNKDHVNKYFHDYYEKDTIKKIVRNMRNKSRKILRGEISPIHSSDMFGCDLDFFRAHLESHFIEGMSWGNYGFGLGKWNIHHNPPLASYDYSVPSSYKEAFHWSHSFPKWTSENISENSWYNGIRHYYKK